jgi:hypothetical protein
LFINKVVKMKINNLFLIGIILITFLFTGFILAVENSTDFGFLNSSETAENLSGLASGLEPIANGTELADNLEPIANETLEQNSSEPIASGLEPVTNETEADSQEPVVNETVLENEVWNKILRSQLLMRRKLIS